MKQVAPYKTSLDEGNAYWMARMAKAVYMKKSDQNQMPDEAGILSSLRHDDDGFISVFGVDNNSAQAALIEHQDYFCLAFRGTNETADWWDNLEVRKVQKLFGHFHEGFWASVEDVWQALNTRLLSLQKEKRRPVFITGHSLGGAMATIAAARFIEEDRPFTSVYTFGQPRAVARDTVMAYNTEAAQRHFRFHNNNDIVTRVPPRAMGYGHVGRYLYITDENTICPEPGFWYRFMDQVDGAVSDLFEMGIDGVKDHDMSNYLAYISKWQLEG